MFILYCTVRQYIIAVRDCTSDGRSMGGERREGTPGRETGGLRWLRWLVCTYKQNKHLGPPLLAGQTAGKDLRTIRFRGYNTVRSSVPSLPFPASWEKTYDTGRGYNTVRSFVPLPFPSLPLPFPFPASWEKTYDTVRGYNTVRSFVPSPSLPIPSRSLPLPCQLGKDLRYGSWVQYSPFLRPFPFPSLPFPSHSRIRIVFE